MENKTEKTTEEVNQTIGILHETISIMCQSYYKQQDELYELKEKVSKQTSETIKMSTIAFLIGIFVGIIAVILTSIM